MNIWQKLCVAIGLGVIALMFLVFPVQTTKEVPLIGFGSVDREFSRITEGYIDYQATALRSIGIVAATGGLVVLLGFIKK